MNLLAIDQGTSATKALVVATEGGTLAEAEVPVHPAAAPGGGVEQDPEELYRSVVEAGRRALDAAGEPVAAVGFANQGETVLAWTGPRAGRCRWHCPGRTGGRRACASAWPAGPTG